MVFIPTILFCTFGLLHYCPITSFEVAGHKISYDGGMLFMTIMFPIYLYIELVTGIVSTVFYGSLYYISLCMFQEHSQDAEFQFGMTHFYFLVAVKSFAWCTQFIGHGVFEGRAPALLSNIFTTMVAPDFVFIEVLGWLGYNKKLLNECDKEIEADIAEFRAQKNAKKAK